MNPWKCVLCGGYVMFYFKADPMGADYMRCKCRIVHLLDGGAMSVVEEE